MCIESGDECQKPSSGIIVAPACMPTSKSTKETEVMPTNIVPLRRFAELHPMRGGGCGFMMCASRRARSSLKVYATVGVQDFIPDTS